MIKLFQVPNIKNHFHIKNAQQDLHRGCFRHPASSLLNLFSAI